MGVLPGERVFARAPSESNRLPSSVVPEMRDARFCATRAARLKRPSEGTEVALPVLKRRKVFPYSGSNGARSS